MDPALRTPELEGQILDTAGQHLTKTSTGGGRRVPVWSAIDDTLRHSLLSARGYRRVEGDEVQEHLRHGLRRAVLTEGLARLWSLGATTALVTGLSPGANAPLRRGGRP
ncbi:MAG: hypothetical protein NT102_00440 [Caldiserica bacterium]|nr:hypothetical protein [Caldisericota bacterium]